MVGDGLAALIRASVPDAQVSVERSFRKGFESVCVSPPDFLVLDLHLPDAEGLAALRRFRDQLPGVPIAIVSGDDDPAVVLRCLQMGARAFVPKVLESDQIQRAFQVILSGGSYAPESALAQLPAAARRDNGSPWSLSARQMDVAALLVDGMSNKQIARRLDIVESTVKLHVSAILRELRVANRSQAVLVIARSGLRVPTAWTTRY